MRGSLPVLITLAVLVLAGCITPKNLAPASTLAPSRDGPRPEIALPKFDPLTLLAGGLTTEPNVKVAPNDHVFVTATGESYWRSVDGGKTFKAMGKSYCADPAISLLPVPCSPVSRDQHAGPIVGGGDGSLAIDSEGRVFWLGLGGANTSIPFQRSLDDGVNWSQPLELSRKDNSTDREWLAIGPHDEVYAVWRDFGGCEQPGPSGTSFDCMQTGPSRLAFRASVDHGATFASTVAIVKDAAPIAGEPSVSPVTGTILVPIEPTDSGTNYVMLSRDGGASWTQSKLPGRDESTATGGTGIRYFIFPVSAADAAGAFYVAWAEDETIPSNVPGSTAKPVSVPHVFLAYSLDDGATWSKAARLSPPDRAAVFPAIAAGAPGRVSVAWYEAATPLPSEDTPNEWNVALAQSTTADRDAKFTHALATAQPIHLGSICTAGLVCSGYDRTRGDFFEIALRPNGLPVLAFIRDRPAPEPTALQSEVAVVRVASGTPMR